MNKDEDLRIQEILDQKIKGIKGVSSDMMDTEDLKAYELIYEQLGKEPIEHLSLSFKANVLRRIKLEKKRTSDTLFYWGLAIISLIGIIVIAIIFFAFKDAFAPILVVIDKAKGFIGIGIVAILVFTIVEKRLIKSNI
ncbi:hypothetical protein [Pedobacter nototheniae]|uniref:hypothetical protein n=1 Tax=Pedobacter nototheniae TaxID=2488994 RepID=UPI00103EEA2A|nr:hypothetical protein [Pedobacter nototheniae]